MLEKNIDQSLLMKRWGHILNRAPAPKKTAPKKTMIMPPPNVTGSLHMGHALTFTLQDIWARFWRTSGYDVLAQPGLDHAGIATQMMVEKQLAAEGTTRQELGREKFLKRAFAYKESVGHTIIDQLKTLGISANWDRLKFTLDADVQQTVRDVFVHLYDEGLIYRSKRLVYWDTKLQTALSNLEVQTKEVKGKLWTLRYEATDNPLEAIEVATTRPETLFGDVAVAVHPDDLRYTRWIGRHVCVPLTGKHIPVIADTHVEKDKGSGALKITPAHDFVDAEVGQAHNLDAINILDEKGLLNKSTPEAYQGLTVAMARKQILAALREKNLLASEAPTVQMIPTGDRSGTVLEPRLTEQWFLDVKPLAKKALKVLEDKSLTFVPTHYGNTYKRWLEHIEPWCLSRQLWWGHAIPAWHGPDGKAFVAHSEADANQKAEQHYGKPVSLTADPDVLDTWFSSALWPLVTLGWPQDEEQFKAFYPTSTLVTGFDIIFFWVARMVMLGTHLTEKVPFKTVYIHGLVRDAERQKMSKTKGNVVNPLDVMHDYGIDPLRFALALGARPGRDIAFSKQHVEGARNFLTKLWNAARFVLNKGITVPDKAPKPQHAFNIWVMHKLHETQKAYHEAMEAYRFDEAAHFLYTFVWSTYCDVYVEMLKKLVHGDASDTTLTETKQTAGWVFGQCLHMLFPFTPFVTSEIWGKLAPGKPALHTCVLEPLEGNYPVAHAVEDVEELLLWMKEVRRLRATLNIPFGTMLSLNLVQQNSVIQAHQAFLEDFLHVSIMFGKPTTVKGCFQGVVRGCVFTVPLEGVIDPKAEKVRLEKKHDQVTTQLKSLEKRLSNPDFKTKADPARIAEAQENLQTVKKEEASLAQMLRSLS